MEHFIIIFYSFSVVGINKSLFFMLWIPVVSVSIQHLLSPFPLLVLKYFLAYCLACGSRVLFKKLFKKSNTSRRLATTSYY